MVCCFPHHSCECNVKRPSPQGHIFIESITHDLRAQTTRDKTSIVRHKLLNDPEIKPPSAAPSGCQARSSATCTLCNTNRPAQPRRKGAGRHAQFTRWRLVSHECRACRITYDSVQPESDFFQHCCAELLFDRAELSQPLGSIDQRRQQRKHLLCLLLAQGLGAARCTNGTMKGSATGVVVAGRQLQLEGSRLLDARTCMIRPCGSCIARSSCPALSAY